MIRLDGITNEWFTDASLHVAPGSACKIILGSNEEKDALLRVMLGLKRPAGGDVHMFGSDIYGMTDGGLDLIYKKTGVVWEGGGLISNLCVWENIMLPLWYHKGLKPQDVEEDAVSMLVGMGKDRSELPAYMNMRPGLLPAQEKTLAGMVRAMLMEPELMIYDSIFEGMKSDAAGRVAEQAVRFHSGLPGRTSVFLSANERSLSTVSADTVIRQADRGFSS